MSEDVYRIIKRYTPNDLEKEMNILINDGWMVHGSPFTFVDLICQCVVRLDGVQTARNEVKVVEL